MKNEHLLPVNIVDLVEKFSQPNIRENEKMNYQLRLEAIRDYCSQALNKNLSQKVVEKKNTRSFR